MITWSPSPRATKSRVARKEKAEGVTPVIPDNVIHYNILTKLPPKFFLKFKSVCKSWYNLTNSKSFMNAYQNYTLNKSSESTNLVLIIKDWCNKTSFFYTYLDAPRFVCGTSDAVIDIKDIDDSGLAAIKGLDNGLVCLELGQSSKGYMLFNPITRDFSGLIPNHSYEYHTKLYGFGYDHSSDGYKIVNIQIYHKSEFEFEFEKEKCVKVVYYSTSSNSWKQYEVLDRSILPYWPDGPNGKVVNNKLHWVVERDNQGIISHTILTFDLHTKEIGNMSFPTQLQQVSRNCDLMVSTDGRLFTVATLSGGVEIWVMKRWYGEAESWTRCYKFNVGEEDSFERIIKVITYRSIREVGDEVLVLNTNAYTGGKQLDWYNIENKSIRKVDDAKYLAYPWVCKPALAPIPIISNRT